MIYKYSLSYQHTNPTGGKKVKERMCEVSIPFERWAGGQYHAMEKWLSNQEGGGDITIIEVKEA